MTKEDNHDVIDGEIPKDLGKSKAPIWLKVAGLGVLVVILGAATFVLNNEKNRTDAINVTKGHVENFMTSTEPNVDKNAPADKQSNQNSIQLPSTESDNTLAIDISETSSIDEIDLGANVAESNERSVSKPEVQIADIDDDNFEDFEPSAPITITPQVSSETIAEDKTVQALSSTFASKQSVKMLQDAILNKQTEDQERINIIKTGIDMQTVSINRLNALLDSLDSLKSELREISKSKPAVKINNKKTAVTQKHATPSKAANVKKVSTAKNSPSLILLGVDVWGGEEFAQLQHNNQIHLLAKNESINGWRVSSIKTNAVTVVNEKGESFEIEI